MSGLGVFFGTFAPKMTAQRGSIYVRDEPIPYNLRYRALYIYDSGWQMLGSDEVYDPSLILDDLGDEDWE